MNTFKTTLLMTGLILLFMEAGRILGGNGGMATAFVIASATNLFAYWFSDKMVLAWYGARPVSRQDEPELYDVVELLCRKTHLPLPNIYVIPQQAPNAFATGRNAHHAAVAVTQGLLEMLPPSELEAVLGHELAHVLNRDMLTSTLAAAMAGAISMLARMAQWALIFGGGYHDRESRRRENPVALLLAVIIAPLAAMIVQLAISRSREYAADKRGAEIIGDPLALASALRRIEQAGRRVPMEAEPATAHLFIVNPLSAEGIARLFSTHPPTEERVKKLRSMSPSPVPKEEPHVL